MNSTKYSAKEGAAFQGRKDYSLLLLTLFILLFVFATALFLPSRHHHHCTGEGCPICALAGECTRLLPHCRPGLYPMAVLLPGFLIPLTLFQAYLPESQTLVDKKVRLDN